MRRLLASLLCLALATAASAQCTCIDKGDIKERMKMATAAINAYGKELPAMGLLPCTAANRATLQARVNSAIGAAQTPGRLPPRASGGTTNNCEIEVNAPNPCLEAAIRAHEKVHQDACRATWEKHQAAILAGKGKERFEALGMNLASYMVEEITGYQAELAFLAKELARLNKDCDKPPPPHRHYTPGGGDDSSPPRPGLANPRSGDPLAPPPMPKPKPLPQPKPID